MDRHQDDANVQTTACGALWILAANDANKVTLTAAEAHFRIIHAMDQHQDDARVQTTACGALQNLAVNNANKVTLVAAEAHVRIIRAMDRHQDDAKVQTTACGALMNLSANDANNMTLAQAATAQIVLTMRLHPTEVELVRFACKALSRLAAQDDSKVLMTRAGADVALLEVIDRYAAQNYEDWGEAAAQDADPIGLALVPCARRALRRLAANADSRVDDSWSVVVDRLRLIRIELLDLSAWAQSAATRTTIVIKADRSMQRFQGVGRAALTAQIAVSAFGTELVPVDGWKTAGGGGRDLTEDSPPRSRRPTASHGVIIAVMMKRMSRSSVLPTWRSIPQSLGVNMNQDRFRSTSFGYPFGLRSAYVRLTTFDLLSAYFRLRSISVLTWPTCAAVQTNNIRSARWCRPPPCAPRRGPCA
jgi:hypothetical protein